MLKTVTNSINASQIQTPITLPGDVTLSTGNLVQGTAAKGFNFTANTPAAGMTSQLLNWYEEGSFTPTILAQVGAFTTVANNSAKYTRVGNQVTVSFTFVVTNLGTGSFPYISNLPFVVGTLSGSGCGINASIAAQFTVDCLAGGSGAYLYKYDGTSPVILNQALKGTFTYFI